MLGWLHGLCLNVEGRKPGEVGTLQPGAWLSAGQRGGGPRGRGLAGPRPVTCRPAPAASASPERAGRRRLEGSGGRGLSSGVGPMAAATAVAAGGGPAAGAESAEGPRAPAAALELWLSE